MLQGAGTQFSQSSFYSEDVFSLKMWVFTGHSWAKTPGTLDTILANPRVISWPQLGHLESVSQEILWLVRVQVNNCISVKGNSKVDEFQRISYRFSQKARFHLYKFLNHNSAVKKKIISKLLSPINIALHWILGELS